MSESDFITQFVAPNADTFSIDLEGNGGDRPRLVIHDVDSSQSIEASLILV